MQRFFNPMTVLDRLCSWTLYSVTTKLNEYKNSDRTAKKTLKEFALRFVDSSRVHHAISHEEAASRRYTEGGGYFDARGEYHVDSPKPMQ